MEATAHYDVLRLGGPADVARQRTPAAGLGTLFAAAMATAATGLAEGDGDALARGGYRVRGTRARVARRRSAGPRIAPSVQVA